MSVEHLYLMIREMQPILMKTFARGCVPEFVAVQSELIEERIDEDGFIMQRYRIYAEELHA